MMSKFSYVSILSLALALGPFIGCSHTSTDAQVASEVQNKINSDANIATKQVSVAATDGVVTLSGTVGSDVDRNAALNDASSVQGVKSVVNNLQLAPAAVATMPGRTPAPTRQKGKSTGSSARRSSPPASIPQSAPSSKPEVAKEAPAVTIPKEAPTVTIPEGTSISIRLIDSIDSDQNKPGDSFSATVESPLVFESRVIVPKNADVEGRIQDLKSAGHFAGRSELTLVLTKLSFNGKTYPVQTDVYTQGGASRGKRTAATVGGGAAVGALIGGLTGGGKGALIGAGVGAGAGTGVQAVTKGQQIRLASETVLEFRLNTPLTIR